MSAAVAKSLGLTTSEADALQWALHLRNVLHGAACLTGRSIRRETMRRLETRGLVREVEVRVVDGDGWGLEPERIRTAYELTDAGLKLAQAYAEAT